MKDSKDIISIPKFSERILLSNSIAIKKRIEYLSKIDYKVYAHLKPKWIENNLIFTIIILVYNANKVYIEESINSALSQTYVNTEIIIIDNGTTGDLSNRLESIFLSNSCIKLIKIKESLYNPLLNDFLDPIPNFWNAGLFCSVGEYVYFLSYDDRLSDDYVYKMMNLFNSNNTCLSAAPLVVSINEEGFINEKISDNLAKINCRTKYTDGLLLAKSIINKGDLIGAPGGYLAQQSNNVLKYGGFDKFNDITQIIKIGIHGVSGYDPTAILYWRHHSQQANKIQKQMGLVYYKEFIEFFDQYDIYAMHEKCFGADFAEEFNKYIHQVAEDGAIYSLVDSCKYGFSSGYMAFKRILIECPPKTIIKVFYRAFLNYNDEKFGYVINKLRHVFHFLKTLHKPNIAKL